MATTMLSCTYVTMHEMVEKHNGNMESAAQEFHELIRQGYVEAHAGVQFVLIDRTYKEQTKHEVFSVDP